MSTDIHFVIEQLHDGQWIGTVCSSNMNTRTAPIKSPCYEFFRQLAGVRGDYDKPLHGVPENASELSKLCVKKWGVDGHSHSHTTLKHFVSTWFKANPDFEPEFDFAPEYSALGFFYSDRDNNKEETRVVFWFDN